MLYAVVYLTRFVYQRQTTAAHVQAGLHKWEGVVIGKH